MSQQEVEKLCILCPDWCSPGFCVPFRPSGFLRLFRMLRLGKVRPSLLHHGGRWSRVCLQIPKQNCNLQSTYYAQLCLSKLHQHLSAFCQIFQSQYASLSAECCWDWYLVARCLPCRERQLRSSEFPNQTDNLSLRCFSRNSKNYSFSRLVPSLLHHGGRWSRVCLQIPKQNCNL